MNLVSKYYFYLISTAIIILIIGALFYAPLTGEYTFSGVDSLSPSAIKQGISFAENKYGEYPLWMPWVFSGLPSIHSFQNISDYYFLNYLINVLQFFGVPIFWNYVFHFIIAGMGVIAILRKLGISKHSSLYGGLSFILMPYLITMVVHGHGSQMMTMAWFPWLIWAILNLYENLDIKSLGILSFIIGLQMQRAHVQIAYYSWMAGGLLIIMLLFRIYANPTKKSKWIFYVFVAFSLGLCMAMWIYLPAINYTPHSIRGGGIGGGVDFGYATSWSFSFTETVTFLIPSFYGFGGGTYWGSMPFTDYPNYMGIIVLLFSLIGIFFHKSKIKWFFVLTAILALLFSFGKHFFLYKVFYDYFPLFSKFRVPAMFLILTQFSIAVLAGLGMETSFNLLTSPQSKKSIKYLFGIILVLVGLFFIIKLFFIPQLGYFPKYPQTNLPIEIIKDLDTFRIKMINNDFFKGLLILFLTSIIFYLSYKGWIRKKILIGSIICLSIIDLILINKNIIKPDETSYRQSTMKKSSFINNYLQTDEIIQFLQNDTSKYRIFPLGHLASENRWSAFNVESIEGYHPAKIFRYNKVRDEVGWSSLGLLQMLNVKYIISLEDLIHPAFNHVFTGKLFFHGKYVNANVYKFNDFMPRAFFVHQLEYVSNNDVQVEKLRNNKFNPLTSSFVEHNPKEIEYNDNAKLNIKSWTPNKIEFHMDVPSQQFLLISEIFYSKGWRITSHPDWDIHPVNIILRGIYVPPGSHRMVMEFVPKDVYYGTILTWASTVIIIILIIYGIIYKRKK